MLLFPSEELSTFPRQVQPARAIERIDERVDGPRASSRMRSIVQAEKAHPTIRRDQASRTTAR
jgi:hypothetical protein